MLEKIPHKRVAMLIRQLKGDLLHKSKDTLEDHINWINKYSTMSAKVYLEQGKRGAGFKLVLSPLFTFLKGYIIKLGFLDGYAGFMYMQVQSCCTARFIARSVFC